MTWQDTAKRLAAHPEFKWVEGMKGTYTRNYSVATATVEARAECARILGEPVSIRPEAFPDLTDWPTVGVLLGMVVEALRNTGLTPYSVFFKISRLLVDWIERFRHTRWDDCPVFGVWPAELWLELKGEDSAPK